MRGHRGERCGHNPLAYDTSWSDGNSELLAHSGSRDQSSRFAGDIARSIGDSSYYGYTGTNTRACFPNSRQCDGQTGKHPGRERAGSLFYSSPSGDGQCRPGKPPRGRKPSTGPRHHRRGRLDGWAWPQIPLDSSPVNSCIAVVHGNQARPPLTGGVTSNQRVMTHAAVSVAELLLFTGRPAGATWAPGRSLWRMGCTPRWLDEPVSTTRANLPPEAQDPFMAAMQAAPPQHCPKCRGFVVVERDFYGTYGSCLTRGYVHDVISSPPVDLASEKAAQPQRRRRRQPSHGKQRL